MINRAILWDMDGTLVDSEPAHLAAFQSTVDELGLSVAAELHDSLLGCSGDAVFSALQAATGVELSLDEWTRRKHGHFERHAKTITRREPAASYVHELASRGVKMALVSNSTPEEVAFCLAVSGLETFLRTIVSRVDVDRGKPSPDGYLLAAQLLRVEPSGCLVIEDSPTGAQAGLAAGMNVVFHPQFETSGVPAGAAYLQPGADCTAVIDTFLKTGKVQ